MVLYGTNAAVPLPLNNAGKLRRLRRWHHRAGPARDPPRHV